MALPKYVTADELRHGDIVNVTIHHSSGNKRLQAVVVVENEFALLIYQRAICEEWSKRGFKDTCWLKTLDIFSTYVSMDGATMPDKLLHLPSWYFDEDLRLSHKSNLVRKDASYYSKQWPDVKDNLPYIWPKP